MPYLRRRCTPNRRPASPCSVSASSVSSLTLLLPLALVVRGRLIHSITRGRRTAAPSGSQPCLHQLHYQSAVSISTQTTKRPPPGGTEDEDDIYKDVFGPGEVELLFSLLLSSIEIELYKQCKCVVYLYNYIYHIHIVLSTRTSE